MHFGPDAMEAYGGTTPGPAETAEAAHAAALTVVQAGRESAGTTSERLVRLVDDVGLDTLAQLWSARPARSLPGVLWRLYIVREWVQRQPVEASRQYSAGMRSAEVSHVIAGIGEPPTAEQVRVLADRILTGVFDGDLAVALERCAAFCRVIATGRAELDDGDVVSAAAMLATAEDLEASATLWRAGSLH